MGHRGRPLVVMALCLVAACSAENVRVPPKQVNQTVIPAVTGRPGAKAKNLLRARGLRVTVRTQSFAGVRRGTVVAQHPDQGKLVPMRTRVTITVTR